MKVQFSILALVGLITIAGAFQNCSKLNVQDADVSTSTDQSSLANPETFDALADLESSLSQSVVVKEPGGNPVASRIILSAEFTFGLMPACAVPMTQDASGNLIEADSSCGNRYRNLVKKIVIFGNATSGASVVVYRGMNGERKEVLGQLNAKLTQAIISKVDRLSRTDSLIDPEPEAGLCVDSPSAQYLAHQIVNNFEHKILIKENANCHQKHMQSAEEIIEILKGWEKSANLI